jgi:hypothetical protein
MMDLDILIEYYTHKVEELTDKSQDKNATKDLERNYSTLNYLQELKEIKSDKTLTYERWVPVSEDLPRNNDWYHCTVVVNDLPWTAEFYYKNGKWLDNRRIDMFHTFDIYGYDPDTKEKTHKLSYQELASEFDWTGYVVAWMPLAKPYLKYKVESDDNENSSETEKVDDKLDKIKQRIALEKLGYPPNADYYKAIMKCLQIIDDTK